ncbi:Thij pfpi [Carnimonas sp. R-84981]|uniref:DJ-1/PfpI family protein n=1 Tax=Carnimonas bestiolae TaxID=3402172 RepID=UPI003EDC2935
MANKSVDDGETLDFIRAQAAHASLITSVCTGSLVLGAAGLLEGYRATSHWMSLSQLKLLGAIPVQERVVCDRNRITGAGVSSGIDFAFVVLEILLGPRSHKMFNSVLSTILPRSTPSVNWPDSARLDHLTDRVEKRQIKHLVVTHAEPTKLFVLSARTLQKIPHQQSPSQL